MDRSILEGVKINHINFVNEVKISSDGFLDRAAEIFQPSSRISQLRKEEVGFSR